MRVVHAEDRRNGRLMVQLSPRERDILGVLVRGRSNQEIGDALGISPSTVKTYLYHLTAVTGMNRIELVLWVVTFPEALSGAAVDGRLHAAGCTCGRPLCALNATRASRTVGSGLILHPGRAA